MADLMSCRIAKEYPPRRIMSALFLPLFNRRRLLPPQDSYLRRDIGLGDREVPRNYWEYW